MSGCDFTPDPTGRACDATPDNIISLAGWGQATTPTSAFMPQDL